LASVTAAPESKARVAICERGSHMAMYDDQRAYFEVQIPFLHDAYANRHAWSGRRHIAG